LLNKQMLPKCLVSAFAEVDDSIKEVLNTGAFYTAPSVSEEYLIPYSAVITQEMTTSGEQTVYLIFQGADNGASDLVYFSTPGPSPDFKIETSYFAKEEENIWGYEIAFDTSKVGAFKLGVIICKYEGGEKQLKVNLQETEEPAEPEITEVPATPVTPALPELPSTEEIDKAIKDTAEKIQEDIVKSEVHKAVVSNTKSAISKINKIVKKVGSIFGDR